MREILIEMWQLVGRTLNQTNQGSYSAFAIEKLPVGKDTSMSHQVLAFKARQSLLTKLSIVRVKDINKWDGTL